MAKAKVIKLNDYDILFNLTERIKTRFFSGKRKPGDGELYLKIVCRYLGFSSKLVEGDPKPKKKGKLIIMNEWKDCSIYSQA